MKLTNEEIARVLNLYTDCNTDFSIGFGKFNIGTLKCCYTSAKGLLEIKIITDIKYDLTHIATGHDDILERARLRLTPLPSIADEHAIQLVCMYGDITKERLINFVIQQNTTLYNLVEPTFDLKSYTIPNTVNPFIHHSAYQYLISKGYAVPLFLGIDHWANGKNAIELGIAIDSTTLTK